MRNLKKICGLVLLVATLGSCSSIRPLNVQDEFISSIRPLCGKAFSGRLVTSDPQDSDLANQPMIMHVASCTENEIRIPFHVGENRSRTWIISKQDGGLRLKHRHRHEDGTEDISSQYGGDTKSDGTPNRQEFPADDFSKSLFIRTNIPNSANNIWAVEIEAGKKFSYELRRSNRHFRVEFDLQMPIAIPPSAWGGN
jgi:hypothetical protein